MFYSSEDIAYLWPSCDCSVADCAFGDWIPTASEIDYYRDDPMVKRLLGLNRIPDVATVSRALAHVDGESIEKIRQLCRGMVIERLRKIALYRLTLDFDGSVYGTQGRD